MINRAHLLGVVGWGPWWWGARKAIPVEDCQAGAGSQGGRVTGAPQGGRNDVSKVYRECQK